MRLPRLLNRESEMAELEDAWNKAASGAPQLVVAWGRRRVGKTFLLSHFVQGKRSLFFAATEQAQQVELARLLEAVSRDLGSQAADLTGGGFATWEAALRFLAALARDEPLVAVLDEIPYIADSTPAFASIVQSVWDHVRPGTKLLLVLTGSSIGTIESMLTGPLRGRPQRKLALEPMTLPQVPLFLPRLDSAAVVEAYGACGGYPLHLRQWDEDAGTRENLLRLAATPGGILLEDATSILREELPDVGGYRRILAAIGRGYTRFSEIQTEAKQQIAHPMDVLQDAGFVRKGVPLGAPRKARGIYEIPDPYLAFWFRVLYSDISLIEAGQGRAVLQRRLPHWQQHVGWVFEEGARAHATRLVLRGELPQELVIGRWWASSGNAIEIDVLGLKGTRTALLGEAQWQERPLGIRELERLRRKISRVPRPVEQPTYALWGRGGVERDIQRAGALGFQVDDVISH